MTPPFDLQGGALLAGVRGASLAALLSATGAVAFRAIVVPLAFAHAPADATLAAKRRLLLLVQASIAAGLLATLGWLAVQSGDLADADTAGAALAALPTVLAATAFGHVIAAQLAILLLLAIAVGRRRDVAWPRVAAGVAVVAVCLQAGHSHAAAMSQGPSLLLGCDMLHLLGAAGWLGGLLPLLLVVRQSPPAVGAAAARWFSPLGQMCVGLLLVSAAVQGWVLAGSIPGLVGTAYGWMLLTKMALFAVLLGFAAANRTRFAPALLGAEPARARRTLARSIAWETAAGLCAVAAAVVLSGLPPAMHLQPLWPFTRMIELDAVREDPDFMREAVLAGLAIGAALALAAATLLWRRWRVPALACAAVTVWFAGPHLDVLLADATPTSFYHSPTGFSADTIAEGGALFSQHCAACHGADGAGDGPAAKSLPVPPANLTAGHVLAHSDGELFWWLAHGMRTPEGVQAMPGFAAILSDDQRWALIDYVRAHNVGVAHRTSGAWPVPVRAPGFQASCGNGAAAQPADLHGRFVRLVIGPAKAAQDSAAQVVTVSTAAPAPGICVAADETILAAYATIAGTAPAALPGTQFLIDGKGWLRAMQAPGVIMGWDDPKSLAAEIASVRQNRVAPVSTHMDMRDMKM